MNKIYFSCHGRTYKNQTRLSENNFIPYNVSPFELTPLGINQAKILGKFLKIEIEDLEKVSFISSLHDRSINSTKLASLEMGIKLHNKNYFPNAKLLERSPIEALQSEYTKKYNNDPEIRNFLRNIGFVPAQEIGDTVREILLNTVAYNKTDVIAVLHKTINSIFLNSIGVTVPKDYKNDNCGLYVLDVEGLNIVNVSDYKFHEELEKKVEEDEKIKLINNQDYKPRIKNIFANLITRVSK